MSKIYEELMERGYIEQVTHEEIRDVLDNSSIPFYIGFDPTADSLHVGHFVSMMVAAQMQKAGHKPIILIGGGTASIGDPSGKTDMRRMMTREEINHNVECFKKQLSKFISFEGDNGAIIVNNADWLLELNFVDFMRDIGSLFSVNKMLAAECYKQRMEKGLTFFELGYMLMQSYDFLYLYNKYGCKLQMGGNDQWSNILGGVDLIRRIGHSDSFGLTFKLLTTKEGKKMGKTEKGALWLNPEKTSPYEFYQYWRNIDDADVKTVLSLLTFLPMEEVNRLSNLKDEQINNETKEKIQSFISSFGNCVFVETQKELNASIATNGSSPAILALVAQALINAGVHQGLKLDTSKKLVQKTFEGIAELLKHETPQTIQDSIASPGGTTIEALLHCDETGVKGNIMRACIKAAQKASTK